MTQPRNDDLAEYQELPEVEDETYFAVEDLEEERQEEEEERVVRRVRAYRERTDEVEVERYGPWEPVEGVEVETHPALLGYFVHATSVLLKGQLDVVHMVASPLASTERRIRVLEEVPGAAEGVGVLAGSFGKVSVRTLEDGTDVFCKQQRLSSQFAVEIATLTSCASFRLPTPRLIGVHLDVETELATTLLELSDGEPAHVFFSRPQPLETKVLSAVMFAFCLKCCHCRRVMHNDVALRNFMTDGKSCFEIVDFGLAIVGDKDWEGALPYVHSMVASLQAAPEHLHDRKVSAATDVWQLGWTLLHLFGDADGSPYTVPPFLGSHGKNFKALETARPPCAESCPKRIHEVALGCLAVDPSGRLSIDEVIAGLGEFLPNHKDLLDVLTESISTVEAALRLRNTPHSELLPPLEKLVDARVLAMHDALLADECTSLALPSCVDDSVMRALAPLVQASPVAFELCDVDGNELGDLGIAALGSALANCTSLRVLYAGSNGIGDEGAAVIARVIEHNPQLEKVGLYRNAIGDAGALRLCEALHSHAGVRKLWLNSNRIGVAGASALAEASGPVERLWLQDNESLGQAATKLLQAAVSDPSVALKKVWVSGHVLSC